MEMENKNLTNEEAEQVAGGKAQPDGVKYCGNRCKSEQPMRYFGLGRCPDKTGKWHWVEEWHCCTCGYSSYFDQFTGEWIF